LSATRITVPGLISNPCFRQPKRSCPIFNREGFDVMHELIFPNDKVCHWAICALPAQALSAWGVV
jgi:hypothetical protein